MRVIESGTGQKGWAKEFSCSGAGNGNNGCGAILFVEQGDIFKTHSHARCETTTYITFQCPECEQYTDIYNSDSGGERIPRHVIQNLSSRVPGQVDTGER